MPNGKREQPLERPMKTILFGICAFAFALTGYAQKATHSDMKSGEAGYKVGCSAAAAAGIPSCGEMPSGKQFMPKEEKKDTKSDSKKSETKSTGSAQR